MSFNTCVAYDCCLWFNLSSLELKSTQLQAFVPVSACRPPHWWIPSHVVPTVPNARIQQSSSCTLISRDKAVEPQKRKAFCLASRQAAVPPLRKGMHACPRYSQHIQSAAQLKSSLLLYCRRHGLFPYKTLLTDRCSSALHLRVRILSRNSVTTIKLNINQALTGVSLSTHRHGNLPPLS